MTASELDALMKKTALASAFAALGMSVDEAQAAIVEFGKAVGRLGATVPAELTPGECIIAAPHHEDARMVRRGIALGGLK